MALFKSLSLKDHAQSCLGDCNGTKITVTYFAVKNVKPNQVTSGSDFRRSETSIFNIATDLAFNILKNS